MPTTATVVSLRKHGPPIEAVTVETCELPELAPTQVLVTPLAAPINPADLNVLEGTYPIRPQLPAVVGNEGVGLVSDIGSAVTNLRPGQRVIAPMQHGWWSTARIMEADHLYVVPDDIPVEIASLLTINPPTAARLLADFETLRPGDWLIQNAANSAAGRCLIEIAHAKGLHTVNVVRRADLIPELLALGADVVVTDEVPLSRQIRDLTGGAQIRLGLNAVGGESARQIAKSLAPHGTLVTYGAMAREPLTLENGLLIFRDIRFRGFWLTTWYRQASREAIEVLFAELVGWARAGKFRIPIEKTYRLEEIQAALAHAARGQRTGKVLLQMR